MRLYYLHFLHQCAQIHLKIFFVFWQMKYDDKDDVFITPKALYLNNISKHFIWMCNIVMHQRSHGFPLSSTAMLQNLHCVPIEWRNTLQTIATLPYKALHTGQPPYLAELLRCNEPVQTLLTSSALLLSVPRCILEFGSRAFRISAPKLWNSLPANIRDSPSLPTFRRHLKPHYFHLAYLSPWWPPSFSMPWFFKRLWRLINLLLNYLLT